MYLLIAPIGKPHCNSTDTTAGMGTLDKHSTKKQLKRWFFSLSQFTQP